MISRIKEIIEYSGLSTRAFALKCGIKDNTFSNQLNGVRDVSLNTIISILLTFENISAEWLIRGEGDMIKNEKQQNNKKEEEKIINLIDTIAFQQSTIKNHQKRIDELETENKRLEAQLTLYNNRQII